MMRSKSFPRTRNLLASQGAVTEVLDFITVVGILILSLSIISVAGYPILKNAQEARYIENTRQSFILMAENINKVVIGEAASRSVEMKVYGGRLGVTGRSRIQVNATEFNTTTLSTEEIQLVDQELRSIENSIGDTVIAYEGTGVWVRYPGVATLNVYKPLITRQGNVLILPVVKVAGTSSISGTGMGRIEVKGVPIVTLHSNLSDVKIIITGDYAAGWKDYFEGVLKWNCDGGAVTTCTLNAKNLDVYILNMQMDTEIE